MERTPEFDEDGYCTACGIMASLERGTDLMCNMCKGPPSGLSDYDRGQWNAFNRVLELLQTYDEAEVRRSRLHRDVIELRPIAEV